jgi:hypothetical protein
VEETGQVIAEIQAADPALATLLAGLARDFKYQQILDLIQASKAPQNGL